jgi:hypothetical protein
LLVPIFFSMSRIHLIVLSCIASFAFCISFYYYNHEIDGFLNTITPTKTNPEFGLGSWVALFNAACEQPVKFFVYSAIVVLGALFCLNELIRANIIFKRTFYRCENSLGTTNQLISAVPPVQNNDFNRWHRYYVLILTFFNQKWHIDSFFNRLVRQVIFNAAVFFQKSIEPNILLGLGVLSAIAERILIFFHQFFCKILFYFVFFFCSPQVLTVIYVYFVFPFGITFSRYLYTFVRPLLENEVLVVEPVLFFLYILSFFLLSFISLVWLNFFYFVVRILRESFDRYYLSDSMMPYRVFFKESSGDLPVIYQPLFFFCRRSWFRDNYISEVFLNVREYLRKKNISVGAVLGFLSLVLCFVLLYVLL